MYIFHAEGGGRAEILLQDWFIRFITSYQFCGQSIQIEFNLVIITSQTIKLIRFWKTFLITVQLQKKFLCYFYKFNFSRKRSAMPKHCAVAGCRSTSSLYGCKGREQFESWRHAAEYAGNAQISNFRICINHFSSALIERDLQHLGSEVGIDLYPLQYQTKIYR